MSLTPIFDDLLEEFMSEKRWTPMLATSQDVYAYDVPYITMSDHDELLDPVEPWYPAPDAETIVEEPEEWLKRIDEAIQEIFPRKTVVFNATAADALAKIPAPNNPFDGTTDKPNLFVEMMNQHKYAILNPEKMPTRVMLGLEPLKEEEPASEPEEVQHVFPIKRENGQVRFLNLKDPVAGVVDRVRDGLHGLFHDSRAA